MNNLVRTHIKSPSLQRFKPILVRLALVARVAKIPDRAVKDARAGLFQGPNSPQTFQHLFRIVDHPGQV